VNIKALQSLKKMSYWLSKYGIKAKYEHITGRNIPELYRKKKYRKVIQHNKDDLETSEQLYLKLQEEFPDLLGLRKL